MSTTTAWHTIREASVISGLPESTLRYYEQIGIIAPITRDPSSGHRAYSDADLERLTTVSCLAATGMPLESMRTYLANSQGGREGARRQMELLDAQALRLAAKAESIRMQQRTYRSRHCTGGLRLRGATRRRSSSSKKTGTSSNR